MSGVSRGARRPLAAGFFAVLCVYALATVVIETVREEKGWGPLFHLALAVVLAASFIEEMTDSPTRHSEKASS